jgi:hypothetical protein
MFRSKLHLRAYALEDIKFENNKKMVFIEQIPLRCRSISKSDFLAERIVSCQLQKTLVF